MCVRMGWVLLITEEKKVREGNPLAAFNSLTRAMKQMEARFFPEAHSEKAMGTSCSEGKP